MLHLEQWARLIKLAFSIHFANARNYVPYKSIKYILSSHVFLSSCIFTEVIILNFYVQYVFLPEEETNRLLRLAYVLCLRFQVLN